MCVYVCKRTGMNPVSPSLWEDALRYLFVKVYTCMHACMYVCERTCVPIIVGGRLEILVCKGIYMYACMYVCVYVFERTCVPIDTCL